jgi:ribosome-associated protein
MPALPLTILKKLPESLFFAPFLKFTYFLPLHSLGLRLIYSPELVGIFLLLVMNKETGWIKLDQFLKLTGLVQTGGEAKLRIQDGQVQVNAEVETRRGRKLVPGDCVVIDCQIFDVSPALIPQCREF